MSATPTAGASTTIEQRNRRSIGGCYEFLQRLCVDFFLFL